MEAADVGFMMELGRVCIVLCEDGASVVYRH